VLHWRHSPALLRQLGVERPRAGIHWARSRVAVVRTSPSADSAIRSPRTSQYELGRCMFRLRSSRGFSPVAVTDRIRTRAALAREAGNLARMKDGGRGVLEFIRASASAEDLVVAQVGPRFVLLTFFSAILLIRAR